MGIKHAKRTFSRAEIREILSRNAALYREEPNFPDFYAELTLFFLTHEEEPTRLQPWLGTPDLSDGAPMRSSPPFPAGFEDMDRPSQESARVLIDDATINPATVRNTPLPAVGPPPFKEERPPSVAALRRNGALASRPPSSGMPPMPPSSGEVRRPTPPPQSTTDSNGKIKVHQVSLTPWSESRELPKPTEEQLRSSGVSPTPMLPRPASSSSTANPRLSAPVPRPQPGPPPSGPPSQPDVPMMGRARVYRVARQYKTATAAEVPCGTCGTRLPANVKFCPSCGTPTGV